MILTVLFWILWFLWVIGIFAIPPGTAFINRAHSVIPAVLLGILGFKALGNPLEK